MVQRVPSHLGETEPSNVPPWLMIAGIGLLILVVCAVLFIALGGGARFGLGGISATATPTRAARTSTPAVTILPVTLPPPSPTLPTAKYKVKTGDSLLEIAARYKVSVQAIKNANNLKDDTIRVGDELVIPLPTPTPPPGGSPPTPSGATPTPVSFQSPPNSASPAATPGVIRYIVKRGDTLILIATLYSSTVDAIRVANKLETDLLSIGQELNVPMGTWTPTATLAPIASMTATPTAQFAYAAPHLISPADGTALHGKQDTPMLSWTSPAMLKANEFYVVHIDYTWNGEKKSIVRRVEQGTSVRLKATDYPGANPSGTQFAWYVVIVSQTPPKPPAQPAQILASSPDSPAWRFVWY